MKNKKGFTLIELLAVIVILGLLMAIAIPSVTKYITESRKKSLMSTIGNYITAMINEVNDLTYTFTSDNTIYAIPIECIALERGGTDPFGEWHQASNAYWAYVLVQYDDETSSYRYGFTFKDSAGYGLYPTTQSKLNEQGKQIKTGLSLTKLTTDKANIINKEDEWYGFNVDSNTDLVVLEAESEGIVGDGNETCTLQQKANNYVQVEKEKKMRLSYLIKKNNIIINADPTLTTSFSNTNDASGLYKSIDTNSGKPTYYFRGAVKNNYVKFAGQTWRIIRINEDSTIRMISNQCIGKVVFSTNLCSEKYMYYSNSDKAKPTVDSWYKTNIIDKGYDSYVATTAFCEQAKEYSEDYVPNFKCSTDENGKGILNSKIGLITYDELRHAGRYSGFSDGSVFEGQSFTMSPAGYYSCLPKIWSSQLNSGNINNTGELLAVISLKSDVLATGIGTSSDPYVIQTN